MTTQHDRTIQPEGEVYDLGYTHYDGPRGGRGTAFMAMYAGGIRTVVGLGRGPGAKVTPAVFALLALGPALFIVALSGVFRSLGADPEDIELFGLTDYLAWTFFILALFAAVVAPALLSPDRRYSVIALYAVRPLKSHDYLVARWLAFFTFILAFLLAPQTLLYLAFSVSASNPWDYQQENWPDILAILGMSFGIAVFWTGIAMAAASLTTRRAFASAGAIGFVLLVTAVGGFGWAILSSGEEKVLVDTGKPAKLGDMPRFDVKDGHAAHYARLLIIPHTAQQLAEWTFDERDNFPVSPWYSVLTAGVIAGGAISVTTWRYRKLGA
ncbi:MAG: hypothetical protein QF554_03595 [Dehalococcoidia bacterium]|nr:hypothetical protein [Dehalococcoidia bacterium]